ncbi:MAG: hypothetical protein F6K65_07050 [Moorea sp. SIO3C2]|nr:hypothetical protein [Moorena sp. SIO3C2]
MYRKIAICRGTQPCPLNLCSVTSVPPIETSVRGKRLARRATLRDRILYAILYAILYKM